MKKGSLWSKGVLRFYLCARLLGTVSKATRVVLLATCLLQTVCGCEEPRQPARSPKDETLCKSPEATTPELRRTLALGKRLYEYDTVAARATDAIALSVPARSKARGWVVVDLDDHLEVLFAYAEGEVVLATHKVAFLSGVQGAPTVTAFAEPMPLEGETALSYVARETASHAQFMKCTDRYNTVVLPASVLGTEGWFVYMLAAHKRVGEVVLGGHSRVHVSSDGKQVLNVKPFSKDCGAVPPPDSGEGQRVAIVATSLVLDAPSEVHVFLSLLHRMPFALITANNHTAWEIDAASGCINSHEIRRD